MVDPIVGIIGSALVGACDGTSSAGLLPYSVEQISKMTLSYVIVKSVSQLPLARKKRLTCELTSSTIAITLLVASLEYVANGIVARSGFEKLSCASKSAMASTEVPFLPTNKKSAEVLQLGPALVISTPA